MCPRMTESLLIAPIRMKRHIREALASGREDVAEYIFKWSAWAVQNPGKPVGFIFALPCLPDRLPDITFTFQQRLEGGLCSLKCCHMNRNGLQQSCPTYELLQFETTNIAFLFGGPWKADSAAGSAL